MRECAITAPSPRLKKTDASGNSYITQKEKRENVTLAGPRRAIGVKTQPDRACCSVPCMAKRTSGRRGAHTTEARQPSSDGPAPCCEPSMALDAKQGVVSANTTFRIGGTEPNSVQFNAAARFTRSQGCLHFFGAECVLWPAVFASKFLARWPGHCSLRVALIERKGRRTDSVRLVRQGDARGVRVQPLKRPRAAGMMLV